MTTNVVVCVGELRKCILCAPGMAVNELRYVLGAAFEVDARLIAGTVSEEGVCSPLSMLSRAPSAFGAGVFELLLKPGALGEVAEEREVVEPAPDGGDEVSAGGEPGLSQIADATSLGALDVTQAMSALYDAADNDGHLDRYSFVTVLDACLNQATDAVDDVDLKQPLSTLFDIIRTRTSIHAASQVPANCVRPIGAR